MLKEVFMIMYNVQLGIIWDNIMNIISITNNISQFILSGMAVIAVFYIFSGKYFQPIRTILYPLGMKRRWLLRILILCRKNPRKNIRVFCEYFILTTQGKEQKTDWWKNSIHEFRAFFNESKSNDFIYIRDNCTDLNNRSMSKYVDLYFDYFSKPEIRKVYDLDMNKPIEFCMKIHIKEGYLSANLLMTGLLESNKRIKESGREGSRSRHLLMSGLLDSDKKKSEYLVSKYVSCTSKEHPDNQNSSDIYNTFTWLKRGPSYQVRNQDGHYKLCQYAFGDETNSVNVILNDTEKFNALWNNNLVPESGVLCSLTCNLVHAKEYIDYNREKFNPVNTYFLNKLSECTVSFLLEPIDCEIKNNYRAQNYYCTANIWIMFESISDKNVCFQPLQAITFFELTNMADQKNYKASVQALIKKSFEYFDHVYSDKKTAIKYRYCLSMNQTIENAFGEQLEQHTQPGSTYSKNYKELCAGNLRPSEADIFASFDAFFTDIHDEFSFIEVDINKKDRLAKFGEFYTSVYMDAFKDINTRDSIDDIYKYLKKKSTGEYGKNNYHVVLIAENDQIIGGIICDYLVEPNAGVIEYIAVKEDNRSFGVGTRIYQHALELLRMDAKKNNKSDIDYVLCEIERFNPPINQAQLIQFKLWIKMGFKKLKFNYIQPALDITKSSVPLDLVAWPVNTRDPKDSDKSKGNGMPTKKLILFLHEYAKWAMRIETPEEDSSVKTMIDELNTMGTDLVGFEKIRFEEEITGK